MKLSVTDLEDISFHHQSISGGREAAFYCQRAGEYLGKGFDRDGQSMVVVDVLTNLKDFCTEKLTAS
jgi:hypothetical protein